MNVIKSTQFNSFSEVFQKETGPKNVTVLGLGVTGRSVVHFLKTSAPNNIHLAIINSGDPGTWSKEFQELENIEFIAQESLEVKKLLKRTDLLIRSPGVDPRLEILNDYNGEKISEIELGYLYLKSFCEENKIQMPYLHCVTGTNGKTTTVTVIKGLYDQLNISCFLGGNIGTPLLSLFNESLEIPKVIVLELSSFQTEVLNSFQSNFSTILNITEGHEERYTKFDDYQSAKLNLLDVSNLNFVFSEIETNQSVERFDLDSLKTQFSSLLENKYLSNHEVLNFGVALKAIQSYLEGQDVLAFKDKIKSYLENFKGVKYRLQKIESSKYEIFNDAKSTNEKSSLVALEKGKALKSRLEKPLVFILGGKLREKNIKFKTLFEELSSVDQIYLFGESRFACEDKLDSSLNIKVLETLTDVLEDFKSHYSEGILIFSPGFPSFDQYQNYLRRGEDFETLSKELLS
ncbi:MAG: UDP-N-acetylmuramoyl-L-alanine--D-glutamate ligase [Bacteriovoracaceae bacterium]